MEIINFSADIEASETRRIIAGKIVPFDNEIGNTSVGKVIFQAGSIAIPEPTKVKLLLEHDPKAPIGKMKSVTEDASGIYAEFKIANTSRGSDALIEASDNLRSGLSVGVEVIKGSNKDGIYYVQSASLKEVSLVNAAAFASAEVTSVAASESEAASTEKNETEEKVDNTNTESVANEAVETPAVEAARPTVTAAVYTTPRSGIKTQAQYLEHTIKAKMGNSTSAEWVAHADAEATLTAANDSFTTNPAFKPTQYVSTVIDTTIGTRAAIDAIGVRSLPSAGMTISVPKITTAATVASTAEAAAPSETGIVSSYVNLTVNKYAGRQVYSVELLDRADPSFFQAMLDNLNRAYAGATEAAVIAALTSGGTQATATDADSAGIISFVSTEAPAAYLATGELASRYIAGTGQWGLLMGAKDTTGRPIYSASQPFNAAGSASSQSLRGNVLGLDLYVSNKAVATNIDESAFIVVPSSVAIYESPRLQLSANATATGEISTMLYGYLAAGVLVAGGVRRFNLT
jgi:HK97 family phage prohead protease